MFISLLQNILPGACIALLLVFAFLNSQKNISYWLLLAVTALSAVVFSADSFVLFNGGNQTADIVRLAVGVLLAPMAWMYCESLVKEGSITAKKVGVGAATVVLFYVCLSLVFLLDRPSGIPAESLTKIGIYILKSVLFIEACALIYMIVRCTCKVEGIKKKICYALIAITALCIIRIFYPVSSCPVAVAALLNVIMTVVMAYASAHVVRIITVDVIATKVVSSKHAYTKPEVLSTITEILSADPEQEESESDSDSETESESDQDLEGLASEPSLPQLSEADENSLRYKFENYVIASQKFLTPGLTMGDIAKALDTNRTYISQLVNQTYGMTFPEFLNNLRIDYAEQYILHNREASQQEIAHACGFPSASSFNVTFKKITGVTPKIWLATYDGNNKQ